MVHPAFERGLQIGKTVQRANETLDQMQRYLGEHSKPQIDQLRRGFEQMVVRLEESISKIPESYSEGSGI